MVVETSVFITTPTNILYCHDYSVYLNFDLTCVDLSSQLATYFAGNVGVLLASLRN